MVSQPILAAIAYMDMMVGGIQEMETAFNVEGHMPQGQPRNPIGKLADRESMQTLLVQLNQKRSTLQKLLSLLLSLIIGFIE